MNPHKGMVCLSQLKPAVKRQAWEFIKANRPELAQLLEGKDPKFNLPWFAKATAAAVWVPIEDTGLSRETLATGAL
jgi:hypothetical protein